MLKTKLFSGGKFMVKKSTTLQLYYPWTATLEEDIEDTKGEITSCNSKKTDTTLAERKGTKARTIIYKTVQKKLKM
jgi:hypothetical protein